MSVSNVCAYENEYRSAKFSSGTAILLSKIAHYLEARKQRLEDRRGLKAMMALDESILSDIGISRADVTWASSLPDDVNASIELDKARRFGRS